MPLQRDIQADFSAGSQQDVAPWLSDRRSFLRCRNGLLNDDGDIYRRGGSRALTDALGGPQRMIWVGRLAAGRAVLVGTRDAFYARTQLGPLVSLGGVGVRSYTKARSVDQMLFIPGGTIYGGAREAGTYTTGTIKLTKGSATAEGSGTAWTTNVGRGMLLRAPNGLLYPIRDIADNTTLVLGRAYEGDSVVGAPYTISALAQADDVHYRQSSIYGTIYNRLIVCEGEELRFSEPHAPHQFELTISGAPVQNRHVIAEGTEITDVDALRESLYVFTSTGTYTVRGLANRIVDDLGNSQHRIDRTFPDLIAWGKATGWREGLIVPALDGVHLIDGSGSPVMISKGFNRTYRRHVELGHTPGVGFTYRDHYFLPVLDGAGHWRDLMVCRLDRPVKGRGQMFFPWTNFTGAGAQVTGAAVRTPASGGEAPQLLGAGVDGKLLDLAGYFTPGEGYKADHDGSSHEWELITRAYELGSATIGRLRRVTCLYELLAAFGTGGSGPAGEDDFGGEGDFGGLGLFGGESLSADLFGGDGDFGGEGLFGGESGAGEFGLGGAGVLKCAVSIGVPVDQALWDVADWDNAVWADEGLLEWEDLTLPSDAPANGVSGQNGHDWFAKTRGRYVLLRIRLSGPAAKLTLRALITHVAAAGGVRLQKVA